MPLALIMQSCRLSSKGLRSTGLSSFEARARAGVGSSGLHALPSLHALPGLHAACLPYGLQPRPELVLFVNETSGNRKRRRRGSRPDSLRQAGSAPAEPLRSAPSSDGVSPAGVSPAGPPTVSSGAESCGAEPSRKAPAPSGRPCGKASSGRAASQRSASRRAVLRRFARASARIERSSEYRRSLQIVLELGGELERVLEPTQKERWLALEDALLEHSSRLYRAYFRAGLTYGRQLPACERSDDPRVRSGGGSSSGGPGSSGSGRVPSPAQLELLAAFARLIGLC